MTDLTLTPAEILEIDTVFSPGNSVGTERFEVIERIILVRQREAWSQCAMLAHDLGWLHRYAWDDLAARNPYKENCHD